jgi:pimeloyl-ACP methyl ester carboxylesterase
VQGRTERVPVTDGELVVHVLGEARADAPTVLALHSISSNGLAWIPLAEALAGRVRLLAPDLRGRAESAQLRSTGLADHARDAVAVLDHFGLEAPVLAGHSMGAFAAALAAATTPRRVSGLVLVDGGLPFPAPGTFDVDEVLHGIIGPAMDRLTMVFEDPEAYLDHWRAHPSLGPHLDTPAGAHLAAYLLHDLAGPRGQMRSTSSLECVRADWADLMSDPATLSAVHALQCPARLLWAARGPLGQADGLYSAARITAAHLPSDVQVARLDTDHYGALLEPRAVRTVADAVAGLAGLATGPPSGRTIHSAAG